MTESYSGCCHYAMLLVGNRWACSKCYRDCGEASERIEIPPEFDADLHAALAKLPPVEDYVRDRDAKEKT